MPDIHEALYWFNQDIQGSWYGWIDNADGEVYSNLKLTNDDATMPTEEQVNAKIAELQADLDYQNLDYVKARKLAYKSIQEQLDMQYWDSVNGTTTWKDHIAQVKADNPKPS